MLRMFRGQITVNKSVFRENLPEKRIYKMKDHNLCTEEFLSKARNKNKQNNSIESAENENVGLNLWTNTLFPTQFIFKHFAHIVSNDLFFNCLDQGKDTVAVFDASRDCWRVFSNNVALLYTINKWKGSSAGWTQLKQHIRATCLSHFTFHMARMRLWSTHLLFCVGAGCLDPGTVRVHCGLWLVEVRAGLRGSRHLVFTRSLLPPVSGAQAGVRRHPMFRSRTHFNTGGIINNYDLSRPTRGESLYQLWLWPHLMMTELPIPFLHYTSSFQSDQDSQSSIPLYPLLAVCHSSYFPISHWDTELRWLALEPCLQFPESCEGCESQIVDLLITMTSRKV